MRFSIAGWLARRGLVERAEAIMKDIEARVQRDIGGGPLPPVGAVMAERAGGSSFGELFRPPFLSRTIMMSTFNFLSVVGYYGFAAWVPTLLIDKANIDSDATKKYGLWSLEVSQ